ncbi:MULTISPECIES: helix-turn-helix domain-containing protein [Alistipes]|uniref:helix-turn-helix domain-containing protein n=1 Tax=Alistipes TaxID=239759 RepID=UPI0018747986|nr:helix-turn-helix domain-containing protein [Alistipes onderdonkii]MBE5048856.1 helix-turn-helix domain-containing protein [Alistipes onderdonkii]
MGGDYLTMESEEVKSIFTAIDQARKTLQLAAANYRPLIGPEHYLTGTEVCEYLHISPRTLQTLRDTRQIPFVAISERNILYPESAIRETLTKNYRPTYHSQ